MKRWLVALVTTVWVASAFALEEPDLPTQGEEPGEVEPPLLIQSRTADGSPVLTGAAAVPATSADLAKLERDLTRAKRNASGADRLFRAGIISKVESEERVLKVIRLEAKFAEAKLEEAKRQAMDEKPANENAEAIAIAEAAAQRAVKERGEAELKAALQNLQRQQKLLALGSGRKADVNRAEQKLAELQRSAE